MVTGERVCHAYSEGEVETEIVTEIETEIEIG